MKTTIDQLKETDQDMLAQVVRADLNRPAFELLDSSVRSLSDKGVINPEGLFLFEGHGTDRANPAAGVQPWSVVVKILKTPDGESPPDHLWYWKREVLWFQSGLAERMPGPVRGLRCYRVVETGTSWQIWMENVRDELPPRWTMDHYRLAARALGRWNGRCFMQSFRPSDPWMSRELWRGWLETGGSIPGWRDYSSLPLQRALSADEVARACRVFDDRERYITALNGLPQVFSHYDYHRRNLMIRKGADGQDEVVAIDWAMVGMGPLGGDLYSLVAASGLLSEVDPEDLPALEEVVYQEYLSGLRDEGWDGDPDEIRLAYTAWLALWMGAVGPALIAAWSGPQDAERIRQLFDCDQEEWATSLGKAVRFALDRADEARGLMEGKEKV